MNYCIKCGHGNEENVIFCTKCGSLIEGARAHEEQRYDVDTPNPANANDAQNPYMQNPQQYEQPRPVPTYPTQAQRDDAPRFGSYLGWLIVMWIPLFFIGFIFNIVWACSNQNHHRKHLAIAVLILRAISLVLAILAIISFVGVITQINSHFFEEFYDEFFDNYNTFNSYSSYQGVRNFIGSITGVGAVCAVMP